MPRLRFLAVSASPLLLLLLLLPGCGGDQPVGQSGSRARPDRAELARAQRDAASGAAKQILFGDLHVHTTYSLDAFFTSMPILGGEGSHPPADACDFARHCAGLDFFAITDHARELTPDHWQKEKQAIRQCNAVAGEDGNPDLVAFHGFEWTHVGRSPETHWGHKNVIFKGLSEDEVPARPISSAGSRDYVNPWMDRAPQMSRAGFVDPLHWNDYADFSWLFEQILAVPACDASANTRDLPADCHEMAPEPSVLFRKLDEWGFDSIVIPHGSAWGSYTPPTSSWDKQLDAKQHDPARQTLIEVMSGHGSSEPYRSYREFVRHADGTLECPEPTPDYLPCCWQAGEIMRTRCGDLPAEECEVRIEEARQHAMQAGTAPDTIFPGTGIEEWLDCGQDRRGFKPAYGFRPRGSVQYALSLSKDLAGSPDPLRFRFGLIASSDTHTGRPATGFKPAGPRQGRTDMIGPRSEFHARLLLPDAEGAGAQRSQPPGAEVASRLTVERLASFLYPGGSVAVHAAGRSREAIWDALGRREVYGTSGPRILLWFDLENGPARERPPGPGRLPVARSLPMGSETSLRNDPEFEVRAVGSFVQREGCPPHVDAALGSERAERLCVDSCYYPSDERHAIAAIEVVRIRPQLGPDEPREMIIEDPWRRFECPRDPSGCTVRFRDPEFASSGRDALYYVRALQEATPAINGANLRTRFDSTGRAVSADPCRVGAGADPADACLAETQERAWSSPIFIDHLPSDQE